ncbi:unnamed protein product [Linum trigynum]|uniref:Uncharacterized protein n=1 Tax=Linum trigynum TaxID=586398 RepID=A0AAV2EV41_9ROSI
MKSADGGSISPAADFTPSLGSSALPRRVAGSFHPSSGFLGSTTTSLSDDRNSSDSKDRRAVTAAEEGDRHQRPT